MLNLRLAPMQVAERGGGDLAAVRGGVSRIRSAGALDGVGGEVEVGVGARDAAGALELGEDGEQARRREARVGGDLP